MEGNKYTDTGIAYIARALISNNTLKTLWVGNDSVTDMGLVPLLEALPRLHSLKEVTIAQVILTSRLKHLIKIGECVGRSTLKELALYVFILRHCSQKRQ